MFTGIVTDIGRLRSIEPDAAGSGRRLLIEAAQDTGSLAIGASVGCAGICLTVVARGPGWFALDASAETLARTTLGTWRPDHRINLERALRLGDELGGHLVSGHVDGMAEVASRQPEGDNLRLAFVAGDGLGRLIAAKGSVAIDGVSLTVNEVIDEGAGLTRFGVNLIPHTCAVTTLGQIRPGDRVNLEIDMLARYVARLQERG